MGAADAAAGGGIGGGAAGAGGSTAAGGAGLAGAHHHHHMGAALGSAAAAAAAAVTEATAATLHLGSHPGGGFGRERDVVGAVSRELLSQVGCGRGRGCGAMSAYAGVSRRTRLPATKGTQLKVLGSLSSPVPNLHVTPPYLCGVAGFRNTSTISRSLT